MVGDTTNEVVTIFQMNQVFRSGSVPGVVEALLDTYEEQKKVWRITIRDKDTKEELDVDAGFVLIPEKANLTQVRSEVLSASQEDEELPDAASFLAEDPGKFTFYLDDGKARVKKTQEKKVLISDVENGLCVIPDPEEKEEKKPAAVHMVKLVVVGEPEPEKEEATLDAATLARKGLAQGQQANQANQVELQQILQDDVMLQALRQVLTSKGGRVGEDAFFFLQLAQKIQGSGDEKRGGVSFEQLQKDFLTGKNASLEFILKEEQSPEGLSAQQAVEKAAELLKKEIGGEPLEALKKAMKKAPRTKLGKGKRVVIIGGGYGGAVLSSMLRQCCPQVHVTLIDPKEYFENTPMQLRAMVVKDYFRNGNYVMYRDVLGLEKGVNSNASAALICGKAVEINTNHVVVGSNKQIVPFDYCVNFSGSVYHSDIKTDTSSVDSRIARMDQERENIIAAERVMIAGGGVVGCELSADIKHQFPDKEVILVHAHDHLLPRLPGAHAEVMKQMDKLGVKVHVNERVVAYGGGEEFETESGSLTIPTQGTRVYWCTGYRPATQHLRKSQDEKIKSSVNKDGFVEAEKTLQLKGCPHVFAGGDCLAEQFFANRERMAHYASLHAATILENLTRILAGKTQDELVKFQTPKNNRSVLFVELGMEDAYAFSPPEYSMVWGMFGDELAEAAKTCLKPCTGGGLPDGFMHGLVTGLAKVKDQQSKTYNEALVKGGIAEMYKGFCLMLQTWDDPMAEN
ncbi:unnamed protein product [Amoebophrya sp. A120]|nr:unnamed protein product [Amoebophrya sp. A120]|eukprot:GSA120T00004028001.1